MHKVKQGECIDSIALRYGFFPTTLWTHGENEDLRARRKDRNVLMPGDMVFIPDLETVTTDAATDKKHVFRRKGVPSRVRLRFLKPKEQEAPPEEDVADDPSNFVEPTQPPASQEMEPIAGAPYRLTIDGVTKEGNTDGDGMLEEAIPPNARSGEIVFNAGTPDEQVFPLQLGGIDPVDTVVGARKRLRNLGYQCSIDEDELSPALREVVMQFQTDHELSVTGELDSVTQQKLVEEHGS